MEMQKYVTFVKKHLKISIQKRKKNIAKLEVVAIIQESIEVLRIVNTI